VRKAFAFSLPSSAPNAGGRKKPRRILPNKGRSNLLREDKLDALPLDEGEQTITVFAYVSIDLTLTLLIIISVRRHIRLGFAENSQLWNYLITSSCAGAPFM
jgi:hypothetical protein